MTVQRGRALERELEDAQQERDAAYAAYWSEAERRNARRLPADSPESQRLDQANTRRAAAIDAINAVRPAAGASR